MLKDAVASLPEPDYSWKPCTLQFASRMYRLAEEKYAECGEPLYGFSDPGNSLLIWTIPPKSKGGLILPDDCSVRPSKSMSLVIHAHQNAKTRVGPGFLIETPEYRCTPVLGMKEFSYLSVKDVLCAWDPFKVWRIVGNGQL